MAVVTGNLSDVGLGYLVGLHPEISFVLNGPQISEARVYVTRPETVKPASNGDFTVDLANTYVMHGDAWYEMHVRWQEPGTAGMLGYSPVDVHVGTPLRVPSSGGKVTSLLGGVSNLSIVYVSLSPPSKKLPFMLWLEQNPDSLADPANTGILYRWENS